MFRIEELLTAPEVEPAYRDCHTPVDRKLGVSYHTRLV